MPFTNAQKYAITQVLSKNSLSLDEFDISSRGIANKISYKGEVRLYFIFQNKMDTYEVYKAEFSRYTPSFSQYTVGERKFNEIMQNFEGWVSDVIKYKTDSEMNDPWDFLNQPTDPKHRFKDTGKKFNSEEVEKLAQRLEVFEQVTASEVDLLNEELDALKEVVSELKKELKTQSKLNWSRIAKQIIGEFLKDVIIDPEKRTQVFEKLKNSFHDVEDSIHGFLN